MQTELINKETTEINKHVINITREFIIDTESFNEGFELLYNYGVENLIKNIKQG